MGGAFAINRAFERFTGDPMAEAAVTDLIDPQYDSGRLRAELSGRSADLPDVSAERFAGKAWAIGDVDPQSFVHAVVAIECLCEVSLIKPRVVAPTCAADVEDDRTIAPLRPERLSGPLHLIDPAAFDWQRTR
jgi:hypothetical protein